MKLLPQSRQLTPAFRLLQDVVSIVFFLYSLCSISLFQEQNPIVLQSISVRTDTSLYNSVHSSQNRATSHVVPGHPLLAVFIIFGWAWCLLRQLFSLFQRTPAFLFDHFIIHAEYLQDFWNTFGVASNSHRKRYFKHLISQLGIYRLLFPSFLPIST